MTKALHESLVIVDGEVRPKTPWRDTLNLPESSLRSCAYKDYCEDRLAHGVEPMSKENWTRFMENGNAGDGKL